MWRAVLIAGVLLWAGAPAAWSAPLRLRDAGRVETFVRADGVRYIATAVFGGPATVLDTRTGARVTVAPPPGCALADMHRGTLLWNCPGGDPGFGTGRTHDVPSGQMAVLPALARVANVDQALYHAVGDRWAVVMQYGYHFQQPVYVERASGRVRPYFVQRRDRLVDVDHGPLTRRLCRGQLRPLVPDLADPTGGLRPGDLAIHGRWAAATSYREDHAGKQTARVELQRCGASIRILRVCRRVECSAPVINARIVAWTEHRPVMSAPPSASRLVTRSLRTGRQRASAWKNTALTPLLLGRRLYVHTADGRLLRAAL